MSYIPVIGLEIHVELLTDSKIFCSCRSDFGGDENTRCCPVCLGLPGSLPVLNKKVVELAIRAGLALNCKIAEKSRLDRKNYFYPDLPKAYQISQYDMPLCKNGYIELKTKDKIKKVRIKRIHIEEDTGKSLHNDDTTLIDYNRSGVPLIEIVTQPDMSSAYEVLNFLESLKLILEYIEVSDCRMEQGSMRCDVNINVMNEVGTIQSTVVELKNLNSFKSAVKAIDYEVTRHVNLLSKKRDSAKETRRWDDKLSKTVIMRKKENVEDYRYFPEPDLVNICIDRKWVEEIQELLPELPSDKLIRFMNQYNLSEQASKILVSTRKLADIFEKINKEVGDSKLVSNWIITEVLRRIGESEIEEAELNYKDISDLLKLIQNKVISNSTSKKVFKEMLETGKSPEEIIEEKGLDQISDEEAIMQVIKRVLELNTQSVDDYNNGKDRALGHLIGQVMKETKGKANPQLVNKLIKQAL